MAQTHCIAQLSAQFAGVAAGPQRLFPPGPRLHRPLDEQEGRRGAHLSATRREYSALCLRPLPAQPELYQSHRRRQAACPSMAYHRRGNRSLHHGNGCVAMGFKRRGRSRGGDGLLRRRAHAGDPRRCLPAARQGARSADTRGQRGRPDGVAAYLRASPRAAGRRVRSAVPCRHSGCLRLPRLSMAHSPAHLPAA